MLLWKHRLSTVETPNNRQVGTSTLVHYSEVSLLGGLVKNPSSCKAILLILIIYDQKKIILVVSNSYFNIKFSQ